MCTIHFPDGGESPFRPAEGYDRPLVARPVEVGCFSVGGGAPLSPGSRRSMRWLCMPDNGHRLQLDDIVLEEWGAHRDFVTLRKMHDTLRWLLEHPSRCADFVTVRGALKLIACTPYLKGFYRQQWEVCVSKFGGTLYLAAIDTDTDIEDNKNMTERQARLQAWGFKFEQLMTQGADGKKKDDSGCLEEYCVVLENILGDHRLLYSAEVDAAVPHRYPGPGLGNTACYTELKTSKEIENEGGRYYFLRYKLLTWWAQSFFCGIPEVICGLRDDRGEVKRLEVYRVSTMPEQAMGMWSADACLSFCVKFLDFLKRTVTEDDPNVVYKFHYKGEDTIHCAKMTSPIPRYRVIPDWFVEGMKKKQKSL